MDLSSSFQVLKRLDNSIDEASDPIDVITHLSDLALSPTQVLANAGHVCLYHMNVDSQQWVRHASLRLISFLSLTNLT